MRNVECPYCEKMFEWDSSLRDHYPSEGERVEMECPECEKNFIAWASYTLSFSEHRADCLNGIDHDWQDASRVPHVVGGKVLQRCHMCDDKRDRPATPEEVEADRQWWADARKNVAK